MRLCLSATLALLALLAIANPVFAEDCQQPRLITVSGDAQIKVVPDEVILTLGVETWDKDLNIAKSTNDQRVQSIIGAIEKFNIERKYIQTDFISIEPRYQDQWAHSDFIGYFVRKTIVITLKDISNFEGLLSSALAANANYVLGIEFRTTQLRTYRDQARALAIKAAREKAVDLAKELGQTVGKPYTITEDHSWWWSSYNTSWGGRWGGAMAQNVMQNAGGQPTGETTIAPGQISVSARISVSFELE